MALTNEDLQAIANLLDSKMDQKLQPINDRLDKMDNRFDAMDSRLDKMDSRFDAMDSRLDKMDSRFDAMDNRLDAMDNRLDKLESEVSSLRTGQIAMRKELKEVHHTVADTYDLALDAWGRSTENRTWLEALPK